jgi:hypothetical protein
MGHPHPHSADQGGRAVRDDPLRLSGRLPRRRGLHSELVGLRSAGSRSRQTVAGGGSEHGTVAPRSASARGKKDIGHPPIGGPSGFDEGIKIEGLRGPALLALDQRASQRLEPRLVLLQELQPPERPRSRSRSGLPRSAAR